MIAMLQAREALSGLSWSHPLEYAGEEWWADALADPRARRQTRGSQRPVAEYRGALTIRAKRDHPGRLHQVRLEGSVQPRRTDRLARC